MGIDRRVRHRDTFLSALKTSPQLMGILNVTPDSFSDGGRHSDLAAAVARARAMVAEGAAIVDVGGESTRPGHVPVPEDEELRRVVPALEALAELDAPISIDTSKAAVAREAARLGACVINDVWGLQRDPGMADAVAETGSAVVAMHNRDAADPAIDILDDVERFFERSLNLAAGAGVPFGRILLDPGVGFGKTRQQNHACIWNLDRFRRLGAPILVGLSRKSFIGGIIDAEVDRRLPGTLAADTIALMRGASVLRVHDVVENRAALAVFMALKAAAAPPARSGIEGRRKARIVLALGSNVGDKAAEPAPGAARDRGRAGHRTDGGFPPLPHARPGARPTRTGSSTPARSAGRASSRRRCSNASKGWRSSSAASPRSAGVRESSTSTSSPTTTLRSRPNG